MLLLKTSHLPLLICLRWQKIICYSESRIISALISHQFWIISLHLVIHAVVSRYTVGVGFDASNPQLIMTDFPAARVQQCHAFTCVGIDYARPLRIR